VSISDVHVVRLPSGLQAECSGKSLLRVINAIPHIESGPVQPKANANGGLGVRESQGSKPMPPLSREMDDSLIRLSAFRAGAALVNRGASNGNPVQNCIANVGARHLPEPSPLGLLGANPRGKAVWGIEFGHCGPNVRTPRTCAHGGPHPVETKNSVLSITY